MTVSTAIGLGILLLIIAKLANTTLMSAYNEETLTPVRTRSLRGILRNAVRFPLVL